MRAALFGVLAACAIVAACPTTRERLRVCPPTEDYFAKKVLEPILRPLCASCHSAMGDARGTHFVLAETAAPDGVSRNLQTSMAAAEVVVNGTSALLSKPSGTHPGGHAGGALFQPGSYEYLQLQYFVARVLGDPAWCGREPPSPNCPRPAAPPRALRRLTGAEFDSTIRDLFGFESTYGQAFSRDTFVAGYDNNAAALAVAPLLADQLRVAAEEISHRAATSGIARCPAGVDGRACAADFLRTFGARVFRRPLDGDEVARYLQLIDGGSNVDGGVDGAYEAGVELALTAMLQSPYFLYRAELGETDGSGAWTLDPWALASALSYFFWGTMPDEALFAAARSSALSAPEELERHARRLLASPRSDLALGRFVRQWLGLDRLATTPKDAIVFPTFTGAIRAAMIEEAERFAIHVLRTGDGTLDAWLTSPRSLLSEELALFYGVPGPGAGADRSGFGPVDLSAHGRGGLLRLGALLARHARTDDASPVERGRLVRERFLCQGILPPPAGTSFGFPRPDAVLSPRERYEAHTADSACATCHGLMDPIGFALEGYDGVGRARMTAGGFPIDARGQIVGTRRTDGTFDGPAALASKLASSPEVHACFAQHWVRFATALTEGPELSCLADAAQERFVDRGRDVRELLVGIATMPHFRARAPDDSTGDGGVVRRPDVGPDGGPPNGGTLASPELQVTVRTESRWDTGYCSRVSVRNASDHLVEWELHLNVEGTITSVWGANRTDVGTTTVFWGLSWNHGLAAADTTEFGFCASIP